MLKYMACTHFGQVYIWGFLSTFSRAYCTASKICTKCF
uniref:Uncharacterized protein n=1 Tax=Arundo donax TaxID=35708 RepID=A0A0A9FFI6_ARUDO